MDLHFNLSDEVFNLVTRKTFIEIDGGPVCNNHNRVERRGRSATDTVVAYKFNGVDFESNDVATGSWADHEHEPSTNTPSEGQHLEMDDDDYIGEGVVNDHFHGESPDHSPIHAHIQSLGFCMSPHHGACTPPPQPSDVITPLMTPPGGAITPPRVASAVAPPGVWAGKVEPSRWSAPGPSRACMSVPQVARAMMQPSRISTTIGSVSPVVPQPLLLSLAGCHSPSRASSLSPHHVHASPMHASRYPTPVPISFTRSEPSPIRRDSRSTSWVPSSPPGQFAFALPSVAHRLAANRFSLEQALVAGASMSGPGSVASSPCNSNNGSCAVSPAGQMTPRSPSQCSVPRCIGSADANRTTVVIRNLPRTYTQQIVCELMDSEGFKGRYDFVYLPTDFRTLLAFGYAFVNMLTSEDANDIMRCLEGFDAWKCDNEGKECDVVWSDPYQGLDANIERYRNSPVMHESVGEKYKPMLFKDGRLAPFPLPTKKLRQPRIRRSSTNSEVGINSEVDPHVDEF